MKKLTTVLTAGLFAFIFLTGCDQVDANRTTTADNSELLSATSDSESLGKKSGDSKWDTDGNGYPEAGIFVSGHYTLLYAYDAYGGQWGSVDGLDESTLTICDYVVNYRGDFGNDPYLDAGWIQNHINCSGYDDNGKYNYLIVHETDPRYTGNSDWAIWGTWEYHVLTVSGSGNLVDRLSNPQSN